MPLINHWWQVTLYVSARAHDRRRPARHRDVRDGIRLPGQRARHPAQLRERRTVPLSARAVAEFYRDTMAALADLGIQPGFQASPNEVDPAIPFAEDHHHSEYDPEAARLFWRQLIQADRVIRDFRSHFVGKVSPVHFFWGSFDLACTRFSGSDAPNHPGGAPNCGDWVMDEGYSHELSSCGFWPGGGEEGAFYSYAYPEPNGFADHPVQPAAAFFSNEYKQFLLPYEAARTAADPDGLVGEFLQSTYSATADLGHWDRAALEIDPARWHRRA